MAIALAPWALLAVAAMWGISFVWMKDILDQQDVYSFLACRFLVAALAMLIARPKVITKINLRVLSKYWRCSGGRSWSWLHFSNFRIRTNHAGNYRIHNWTLCCSNAINWSFFTTRSFNCSCLVLYWISNRWSWRTFNFRMVNWFW
jgi:EamA-like transporter family